MQAPGGAVFCRCMAPCRPDCPTYPPKKAPMTASIQQDDAGSLHIQAKTVRLNTDAGVWMVFDEAERRFQHLVSLMAARLPELAARMRLHGVRMGEPTRHIEIYLDSESGWRFQRNPYRRHILTSAIAEAFGTGYEPLFLTEDGRKQLWLPFDIDAPGLAEPPMPGALVHYWPFLRPGDVASEREPFVAKVLAAQATVTGVLADLKVFSERLEADGWHGAWDTAYLFDVPPSYEFNGYRGGSWSMAPRDTPDPEKQR